MSFPSRSTMYVCRACKLRQSSLSALRHPTWYIDTPTNTNHKRQAPWRFASSKVASLRASRPSSGQPRNQLTSNSIQKLQAEPARDTPAIATTSEGHVDAAIARGTLKEIQAQVNVICASTNVPDEIHVLEVLDRAYQFSNVLVFGQTTAPDEEAIDLEEEDIPRKADDIFTELEEPQTSLKQNATLTTTSTLPPSSRERSAQTLCKALYTLLKDDKIHISQPILSIYVRIICQLGNPEYLPEIFFLYANKPQPIPGSYPIQYRNVSPKSPKNAIPQNLSDVALDTAILQRDLPLAVAIIDNTVATRAFRLSKFVRKASLPLAFVGSTPVAAYAAADWVANWQNSLDPQMARAVTLMASAAYIGTLTTLGFVAVTTWNDHHERVRWSEGTPLRYRWMREEERQYFDRIAMAWGFQRKRRRGEEMGGLWEELREECGVRGMVLDKSDLLPGMQ